MAVAQNWGPMGAENSQGSLAINRPALEGLGQTYTTLDLVAIATSGASQGQVVIAAAVGTVIAAGQQILGYPDRDASGVQGTPLVVQVKQPGDVQRMPIYAGAAGNAVTAQTDVFTAYGIRNDATQGWCVSKDEIVATKGRIIGIAADFPVGEPNGLVDFEYFTAQLQGAGV